MPRYFREAIYAFLTLGTWFWKRVGWKKKKKKEGGFWLQFRVHIKCILALAWRWFKKFLPLCCSLLFYHLGQYIWLCGYTLKQIIQWIELNIFKSFKQNIEFWIILKTNQNKKQNLFFLSHCLRKSTVVFWINV